MKIVCLLGSPKVKGNSETIANAFLEAAKKKGAEITTFALNKLTYKGCVACMGCKTKKEVCVLKDDLTQVLDAVRNCDILVMATPVYYGDVTSQLKAFIDRTFCYLVPDFLTNPKASRLKAGKKWVFIQTQNQPDEKMFSDIYPRYGFAFKWYGFTETYQIRGNGLLNATDAAGRKDLLDQATALAEKIVA